MFVMMWHEKSMSSNDVAIVTVGKNNYRIHFCFMTKNEVVNRMKNANLNKNSGQL